MTIEQTSLRAGRPRARGTAARVRATALGLLGLVAVAVIWEVYKVFGPDDGVVVAGHRILPRTTDLAMPHVWEMVARLLGPTTSQAGAAPLWLTVAQAALVSLGIAAVGWVVGTVVGIALGVLMQMVRVAEHGLLPWVVLSQTVPLIAFAPVLKNWGAQIEVGDWRWPQWLSVAVIASYLAFFPVAVGMLKGLQSPPRTHLELMHTYDAGRWATLVKVRLPAAVPYLLPALRLGVASAVVGTVVAEVSTGFMDGIGRQLVSFAGQASGDPAKAWAPIFGAVVLGLVAAGLVGLIGLALRSYRRGEAT
ncbi:ABC transporter permease [Pseudactinotalea suaedae]|uniref:ABC transporter permease n=1 Tax=Pseudactinotalea suaedae TaxID=1524924 RepID=UPI001F502429|nr:ABC transporter permease subunit [Pseudactinotalea suaedae]